jgi:putative heme-binding domain-containing protein
MEVVISPRKLSASAAVLLLAACQRAPQSTRYETPPKFSVEVVAPAAQTGSLVAITFDSLGRPVVSKERKPPVILIDKDGDGKFETEKVFSRKIVNCQGLWFDARVLYGVCADTAGQAGLYRLEDNNADDSADTFEMITKFERTMGEHGPHDIRRGPDGHPTIMLGNHTAVPAERLDPASPYRNYSEGQLLDRYMDARGHAAGIMAPGGYLVRYNRQATEPSKSFTMLFGGFRNAYNHAYNLEGEAFTFDSDMEWDINMPWYREVRSVHAVPGADFGWRTGSGKWPAYFLDSLPPMRDAGRGSPVGVEFYQHNVYPPEFHGVYFEADWSRGRILVSKLTPNGATYASEKTQREFVHGEPLNVTDIEVGPDGCLWFTTGGRDTEGGVYRIVYERGWLERLFPPAKPEGISAIVRQPQPLSSWGYESLRKAKAALGEAQWSSQLSALARDTHAEAASRVQAIQLLQSLGPAPDDGLIEILSNDSHPRVRAAAVWVAGQRAGVRAASIATGLLADPEAFVRRRAAEAVVRMGHQPPAMVLLPLLNDSDRFVRYAGRVALETLPRESWAVLALAETKTAAATELLLALTRTAKSDADLAPVFAKELAMLKDAKLSVDDQLRLIRAMNLTTIAMNVQPDTAARRRVHELLAPRFPHPDERLSRELARTLAWAGQPEAVGAILGAMPRGEGQQQLQIHYAYCLRSIKAGWNKDQKQELLRWFSKASQWRGGASFTGFINLIFDSSLEFFDAEEKKLAYERVPDFAPITDTALLASNSNRGGQARPSVLARKKGVQSVSAQEIFEFQMFDPMTLKARPEAGARLFESECASCHRFGSVGKDFGPDLTTLSSRFKRKDILEAILWPSKTISDQYESSIIQTRDGDLINGLVFREDASTLYVKTGESDRPVAVAKANVKSRRPSKISIMPEGLLDGYSMPDISNLLAYLQSTAK